MTSDVEMVRLLADSECRIKDLERRLAAAEAAAEKYRMERDDNAHAIIECDVVPGVDSVCRCESCRRVVMAMDEAGYCDGLESIDRWWEAAKGGGRDE